MRILFVAMADSVHAARWINQVSDLGWDLHLFVVTASQPHASFKNITIHGVSSARPKGLDRSVRLKGLWPLKRGTERLQRLVNSRRLARLIRRLKPDIIHSIEIQHAGYLTLEAKAQVSGPFPPWIVTNWGSDIYLFGRLPEHKEKIREVLSNCNYYACECHRDVDLAQAFGFRGEVLPTLPNGGGYSVKGLKKFRQRGATSERRIIALKGYQNWAGRALVGLRALELCADALEGYSVHVYLANDDVRLAAELLSQATSIPVEVLPLRSSHEEVLRLHGHARVSIGLSISDAISTSALEAIAMGSFPIQSRTSCLNEWIRDGETGLLVHPESPEQIAEAIRRAISDDEMVDRAAEENYCLAIERLDRSVIQPQVISYYKRIAATGV